jgi:hypothetical protein
MLRTSSKVEGSQDRRSKRRKRDMLERGEKVKPVIKQTSQPAFHRKCSFHRVSRAGSYFCKNRQSLQTGWK